MNLIAQFLSKLKRAFNNLRVAKRPKSSGEEAKKPSGIDEAREQPYMDFKYEAQVSRARGVHHESVDQAVYLAYLKTDPPDEEE